MSNFRMNEIHAFVAIDPKNGDEGLIGMQTKDGWMPFVCGDADRLESLIPIAIKIGKSSNRNIKLLKFSTRTEVEEFKP